MGRGDQVGGVRRSLGVSESLLRQSLLEIDTATFARMVSRGLLHGKTFLSRPLTVRIYFKFSVTQFDNVLCRGRSIGGDLGGEYRVAARRLRFTRERRTVGTPPRVYTRTKAVSVSPD